MSTVPAAEPDRPLLELVRDGWRQGLGHEDFRLDDNFFNVGGHSVKALRVMKSVNAALGTRVPVRLFFENPTVRRLAEAIERHLSSEVVR